RIPRDVMDKRAVEQGDIHFFELAALSVEAKAQRRKVTIRLTDFVIPPDDVPEEVRRGVKHWSQWIDYWAVDWDNKGDAFHNEWRDKYEGVSATTRLLLNYWFHTDHRSPDGSKFAYHYFQREAIETLVYLYEVAKVRRHKNLVENFATRGDLRLLQYDDFARY